MGRQDINNLESGLVVRQKINQMLIELYALIGTTNGGSGQVWAIVGETDINKTLDLLDANTYIKCTNSSPTDITITIPTNSASNFTIGTEIMLERSGSGEVSIVGDTGVTLTSVSSKYQINEQYQVVALKKVDTDTWNMFGALK